MIRALNLIAFSPWMAERVRLLEGIAQSDSRQVAFSPQPQGEPEGDGLSALRLLLPADGVSTADEPAVVILPTGAIRCRRFTLPFQDKKQVRAAIPFELEAELLEATDALALADQVLPEGEQGSRVYVFAVEKQSVTDAVDWVKAQGWVAIRVTFSAQALADAWVAQEGPVADGLHFQVYAGLDECFVSLLRGGRLLWCKALANPFSAVLAGQDVSSLHYPETLLTRLRVTSPDLRALESERLAPFLPPAAAWAEEINRLTRIQALGEPFTVSLHGLFAPLCAWDAPNQRLTPPTSLLIDDQWPTPPTQLGVLQALAPAGEALSAGTQGTFYRRRLGLQLHWRDNRAILIAAGILTLAMVVVFGLLGRLSATEDTQRKTYLLSELDRIYARALPPKTNATERLHALETKVSDLRRSAPNVMGGTRPAMDQLEAVSQAIGQTPGVVLESLAYTPTHLSLTGHATSGNAAQTLQSKLNALPAFSRRKASLTQTPGPSGPTFTLSLVR